MSDTPRTDDAVKSVNDIMTDCVVHPNFARQLERELTQSQQELERVRGELRKTQADAAFWISNCNETDQKRIEYFMRAESAEAKNLQLTAQVAVMGVALQYYANGGHWEWLDADSNARIVLDIGTVAANALSNLHPEAEKLVRIISVVDELLAWDKKYPKDREWQYGLARTIEKELDAIVDKLRDLRGNKT